GEPRELEEERRLAYVGITRARERLYLTNAWSRTLFGATSYNLPSRFLKEVPEELVSVAPAQGRASASRSLPAGWGDASPAFGAGRSSFNARPHPPVSFDRQPTQARTAGRAGPGAPPPTPAPTPRSPSTASRPRPSGSPAASGAPSTWAWSPASRWSTPRGGGARGAPAAVTGDCA